MKKYTVKLKPKATVTLKPKKKYTVILKKQNPSRPTNPRKTA